MTLRLVGVVALAAVAGVVLGATLSALAAVACSLFLGTAGGLLAREVLRRRLHRFARDLDRHVAPPGETPIEDHAHAAVDDPVFEPLVAAVERIRSRMRQQEAAARSDPAWRRSLAESIAGPALVFSADDRLVAANTPARRLLRIPDRGSQITVIQALGSAALAGAVREVRRSGASVQVDAEVADRDLRATASLVEDDVLLMVTDRTEQRRVEELRRNFVTNASHELKTPATAIQALSEALEVVLERNPVKAAELVDRLREESERLVRMVHDLLDLRRLEERGPLERVAVDLSALAREAVAKVVPRAEPRNIKLDLDLPEHAWVSGVPQDLRLVLGNLVTNAVEYNRDGGEVRLAIRSTVGAYEIEVVDTGIGIPQQDLHRIFERFYRVDATRVREREGTGLGLSIVRHAVYRHGGSIRVESLLGEGSTFHVRLPIEADHRGA